jgi:hypothetical protein
MGVLKDYIKAYDTQLEEAFNKLFRPKTLFPTERTALNDKNILITIRQHPKSLKEYMSMRKTS